MTNIELLNATLIVEWENAAGHSDQFAERNIRRLVEVVARPDLPVRRPLQTIVAYDPNKISAKDLEALLAPSFAATNGRVEAEYVIAAGAHYYEQKNMAAARAHGDVLLFVDCDSAVDEDWAREMLKGFADRNCQVVNGCTVMETDTLMDRAAALYWIFPIRSEPDKEVVRPALNTNNFAVRADLFHRIPFPRHAAGRIQCGYWARRLAAEGIRPIRVQAIAAHPSFDRLTELVKRAWMYGADWDARVALRKSLRGASRAREAFGRFRDRTVRMMRRMRKLWRPMAIKPWEAPLLAGLGLVFFGTALIAQTISALTADHEPPVFEPLPHPAAPE